MILISWFIAILHTVSRFRQPIGYGIYSAYQLKTIQEVITLVVFSVFSILYLKEDLRWNYVVGFLLIVAAVFFIFKK